MVIDGLNLTWTCGDAVFHKQKDWAKRENGFRDVLKECLYALWVLRKEIGADPIFVWDSFPDRRMALWADYKNKLSKKKRKRHPSRLSVEMTDTFKLAFGSLGFPQYHLKGEEADDIIATLARRNHVNDHIFVVSHDQDLVQLIEQGRVWTVRYQAQNRNFRVMDPDAVFEYYRLRPNQLALYWSFSGSERSRLPSLGCLDKVAGLFPRCATVDDFYNALEIALVPEDVKREAREFRGQATLGMELYGLKDDLKLETLPYAFSPKDFEVLVQAYELEDMVRGTGDWATTFAPRKGFLKVG